MIDIWTAKGCFFIQDYPLLFHALLTLPLKIVQYRKPACLAIKLTIVWSSDVQKG